mmetsp:Transcript_14120/g.32868  ORF Transcript_14120/g.32868 Transcript_14120/m.32868 type:complete len:253 (-) Transcript_14120:1036-1794(-)
MDCASHRVGLQRLNFDRSARAKETARVGHRSSAHLTGKTGRETTTTGGRPRRGSTPGNRSPRGCSAAPPNGGCAVPPATPARETASPGTAGPAAGPWPAPSPARGTRRAGCTARRPCRTLRGTCSTGRGTGGPPPRRFPGRSPGRSRRAWEPAGGSPGARERGSSPCTAAPGVAGSTARLLPSCRPAGRGPRASAWRSPRCPPGRPPVRRPEWRPGSCGGPKSTGRRRTTFADRTAGGSPPFGSRTGRTGTC